MPDSLHLNVQELNLPLRINFKQVSSVRKFGESIWCEARRGDVSGFGEGCPRTYVTGENIEGAITWLTQKLPELETKSYLGVFIF